MAEFDPQFLNFRGRQLYVGQWLAGSPAGDWGFANLPTVPPLSDALAPRDRLDVKTAGMALARKPRLVYDAWLEVRGAMAGFIATEAKAGKAGFTKDAMRGELWERAGEELSLTAREAADTAFDAHDFIEKSRVTLGTSYFEPEESETERTARDLAIVQRYRDAGLVDRMTLRLRNDPRLLAALTRVPRILSELSDAELEELRSEYVAANFQHASAAFIALADALAAPRQAAFAALTMLEMGCGRLPQDVVAGWGDAAAWVLATETDRQRAIGDALRAAVGLPPLPPGVTAPATA